MKRKIWKKTINEFQQMISFEKKNSEIVRDSLFLFLNSLSAINFGPHYPM
jgi:hypothetical protein